MSNEDAAIWALLGTAFLAGIWFWNERVRRFPLTKFGIDNVESVLKREPAALRKEVMSRGWMTSHEWTSIIRRQAAAIDAEIKRRGPRNADDSRDQ